MRHFYNLHAGQTALLVGNGANLLKTPPQWFDYPSFGVNTIYKLEGWKPTYFVGVDSRLMREDGKAINETYQDVIKFLPTPNLDAWQGKNIHRFYHRPGPLYPMNSKPMDADFMSDTGISFGNVMHVAMQLAAWMGFSTLLMIGVEHEPMRAQSHFWGCDHGMSATPPVQQWMDGYREIVTELRKRGVRVLNISQDTHVPDSVLPLGDWRDWRTHESIDEGILQG